MADLVEFEQSNIFIRRTVYNSIFIFCVALLLLCALCFVLLTKDVQLATTYLSEVNAVNRQIQRLVKMEVANEITEQIKTNIYANIDKVSIAPKFFGARSESQELADGANASWRDVDKELVLADKVGWQATKVLFASERYYYASNALVDHMRSYIEEFTNMLVLIQMAMLADLLALAGFVMVFVRDLLNTVKMAKLALVDLPTTLYNRSACDILLQKQVTEKYASNAALAIFDLNDLKKVNDTLGHRMGDEMIKSFAHIIKDAATALDPDAFVGRYGGDEFIVFLDNIPKEMMIEFFARIDKNVDKANKEIAQYQISYARGFVFTKEYLDRNKVMTLGELLEFADDKMYKNKEYVKKMRHINDFSNMTPVDSLDIHLEDFTVSSHILQKQKSFSSEQTAEAIAIDSASIIVGPNVGTKGNLIQ